MQISLECTPNRVFFLHKLFFKLSIFIFLLIFSSYASCKELYVPEELKPWQDWVLYNHQDDLCPKNFKGDGEPLCVWPAQLDFNVNQTQANFEYQVEAYAASWVLLPKSQYGWPTNININGAKLPVVERNKYPAVYVEKGQYKISGTMNWDKVADFIVVPPTTALVNLKIFNEQVSQVDRDDNHRVWLKSRSTARNEAIEEDKLDLKVFRLIDDSIPIAQTTVINLQVSGSPREEIIGPVFTPDLIPLRLHSNLPVRIEKDGRLKVQVRSGIHSINLQSRYDTKEPVFVRPKAAFPWPEEEVWAFKPNNDLRLVDVQNVLQLDPSQTQLPTNWQNYSAFLMKPKDELILIEKRRGKLQQKADDIALQRNLWLNFAGDGFVAQDNFNGTISNNWRITALPGLNVGRAVVNGKDVLITQQDTSSPPGLEVRQGRLEATTLSEIALTNSKLPAIGWERDVQSLQIKLNTPPGWRVLNISGVDSVSYSWIKNWTLLDFFLVLIIAASFYQLLGIRWGLISLVALVLIFHENNAPTLSWLNVLLALALCKALSGKAAQKWILFYLRASVIALLLIAVPFVVTAIREGLYPQLEKVPYSQRVYSRQVSYVQPAAPIHQDQQAESLQAMPGAVARKMLPNNVREQEAEVVELDEYDPQAKVQTGPGLPKWEWRQVNLKFNGPVVKEQLLSLLLLPAWAVSILKFVYSFCIGLLIYKLLKSVFVDNITNFKQKKPPKEFLKNRFSCLGLGILVPFLIIGMGVCPHAEANFPDNQLLNELEKRLLEEPSCYPNCASIDSMVVNIEENKLTIELDIHVIEQSAVAIPASLGKWFPNSVTLNGEKLGASTKAINLLVDNNSNLKIRLPAGVHKIVASGPLFNAQQLDLMVPIAPKYVSAQVKGWQVEGIDKNKLQSNFLRLIPNQENNPVDKPLQSYSPQDFEPFVTITRTLKLGLDWKIVYQLQRVAPKVEPITIDLDLLAGESILSEHIQQKDNKAVVRLKSNQNHISWVSRIPQTSQINLRASSLNFIKEIWQVEPISKWHCEFLGVPIIHQQNRLGNWLPTWHPWPNEQLAIQIFEPQAFPGTTLTIEDSRLEVNTGKRATENNLSFSIRSSIGGNHDIFIPASAKVRDVKINNLSQPIDSIEGKLTLPVYPGQQQIAINWQESSGIKFKQNTPEISFNHPVTNLDNIMKIGSDRWVLFLGGPKMGPAVLFWGVLIIVIVGAVALGKLKITPLNTLNWLLLGSGLIVATPMGVFMVVAWFVAMQYRANSPLADSPRLFNTRQCGLVLLTIIFVVSLFTSVSKGLLGSPQMQIGYPQGLSYGLHWYQDLAVADIPKSWVISLPMYFYRILMLLWSLWLAFSLIKWLRWGWNCFANDSLWRQKPKQSSSTVDEKDRLKDENK